jgi:transposase-like protein
MHKEASDRFTREILSGPDAEPLTPPRPAKKRGRRRGLPPLEDVARVYNKARANDQPTTQALIDEFGSPESTVRNWVGAARKAGLLDATVTEITTAPGTKPKGPASQGGRRPAVNYVEIAQVMVELRDAGANVHSEIAKRYDVPPSTAKNWMARCREQGLIKPLTAGLRVVEDNTIDPDQSATAVYDGRAVAEQYLTAIRENSRPIQSVADLFDIDKQLAAQWVRRARADGELPPAAEPQLPEQERRAMLDATKPESVV